MPQSSKPVGSSDSDEDWSECASIDKSAAASDGASEGRPQLDPPTRMAHIETTENAHLRLACAALQGQLSAAQDEVKALHATVSMHEATIKNMERSEELRELEAKNLSAMAERPCERCVDKDVRLAELDDVICLLKDSVERSSRSEDALMRQVQRMEAQVVAADAARAESDSRCAEATSASQSACRERDELKRKLSEMQSCVKKLEDSVKELTDVTVAVSLKSEHVSRCLHANKKCAKCKMTLTLTNWFCCHDCSDWNYCRGCFADEAAKHAKGTHSFTDMTVFNGRVANTSLPHIMNALSRFAGFFCSTCKKKVTPTEGNWYRCNECADYDLCKECFERFYQSHVGGAHTFTDMCTFVTSKYGFPTIINQANWKGRETPYGNASCSACGTRSLRNFLHCNECVDYDLCSSCALRDVWREHSRGSMHTFTRV
ncbi:Zinc finger, ZZ type [Novymonas esmeraldas]|uniref:Zinc finger, ZZ type n=1 Tax=Novymonas esmeraldas TaxID=1808958 RepID=A0AAW0EU39_9TRYP